MGLPEKTPAKQSEVDKKSIGQGVFSKCEGCSAVWTRERMMESWEVCPTCGYHHRMSHARWKHLLLDGGHLESWATSLRTADPLGFNDGSPYPARVAKALKSSGSDEAIEVGRGKVHGVNIAFGAFVFSFMGGSMGSVVGERIAVLFETALEQKLPVLLLHASGGARMQEGILSLMQWRKALPPLPSFATPGNPILACVFTQLQVVSLQALHCSAM